MKRMDIFCASQASTAICMSMDQPSSSSSASSSNLLLGGRAIDRHNPIIRDPRRTPRALALAPCTSQPPPINPKPYHLLHNSKKCAAKNKAKDDSKRSSSKPIDKKHKKGFSKPSDSIGKKSSTESKDSGQKSWTKPSGDDDKMSSIVAKDIGRRSWGKPGDLITPPGSSRYLLSDAAFYDGLPDYDPVMELVPSESKRTTHQASIEDDATASKPSSSSHSELEKPTNQVVVLRVSLHCRGCEGKVRKHLSRMEGVTSFNIDFAAKKVTIVGDVTPLGVLASVSKVKSAQFWPAAQEKPPQMLDQMTHNPRK
ncbi:hypothetical protein Tsubulata_028711 [Turnera subulata]|uniref:HMA domain-containing protein n=1 Tax=Turnera subulata TaxID=218843 RepID=A0A9Q0JNE6_9ROSI|nr:hypothetical protein Tsubulata_028711 [Turnera subulata]